MLPATDFFDLSSFAHAELFDAEEPVWAALKNLKAYLADLSYPSLPPELCQNAPLTRSLVYWKGAFLDSLGLTIEYGDATKGELKILKDTHRLEGASVIMAGAVLTGGRLRLGRGVLIESGAFLKSPVEIGDYSEVRQGAYLRGNCLIGSRCVVGHVTEAKNVIFLDEAKAGHFAYLGDSILGNQVNLGAGTKLANLRLLSGEVRVKTPQGALPTGLRKLGAILGDGTQTGCNSVTNPGTLLGRNSMVLPNLSVPAGYHGDRARIL